MIEARQRDPAQIKVLRDLILLARFNITWVADIAVAGTAVGGRVLVGNRTHVRRCIVAGHGAATVAAVLVALLRLRGDGRNEFLVDAGVVLVGPLREGDRAVQASHASKPCRSCVEGHARRLRRIAAQHAGDPVLPDLRNSVHPWSSWAPFSFRHSSFPRTLGIDVLQVCNERFQHFLFGQEATITRAVVGPVRVGWLRLSHPVGNRRVSVQVHDFRLDLVDVLPAELELRREGAGRRQVLDGGHRRLLGLVLGRIATGLRNTPGDLAFLRLYNSRRNAANGNDRQHGTQNGLQSFQHPCSPSWTNTAPAGTRTRSCAPRHASDRPWSGMRQCQMPPLSLRTLACSSVEPRNRSQIQASNAIQRSTPRPHDFLHRESVLYITTLPTRPVARSAGCGTPLQT